LAARRLNLPQCAQSHISHSLLVPVVGMPLCRTYASLDILDGGPPQHVDQPNPFSVSPIEVPPHSAHYDRSQLSQTTVLFRTPVASPISRQSSPLGPYQSSLPDRPIFPRSKSDPCLYRYALMRRFKRSSRGRELFHRKKISSSVTDAITKPKNEGRGLSQVPATILIGSCIVAAGVDWEVVDGMA
jgi:hypothetical protein